MLGTSKVVAKFHMKDGLLFYLGHICAPSRKCVKLIWESHYSHVAGHFGVEKTVAVL